MMEGGCGECANSINTNFLQKIMTGANRMDQLITDALNYARIVRAELPLAPVDLGPLLRGILDTYPNLQPPNVDIRLDGDLPSVMGNEAALTQCFSNLLGNAVKFVEEGKTPTVRIWAEEIGPAAGGLVQHPIVRIGVEDNGIGIAKDYHKKIFEMFGRVDKKHEGTGIGLALVRKNVERMGGKVGVESEPGHGSRFWLELQKAI
jgi:signal transduction histidine kinase